MGSLPPMRATRSGTMSGLIVSSMILKIAAFSLGSQVYARCSNSCTDRSCLWTRNTSISAAFETSSSSKNSRRPLASYLVLLDSAQAVPETTRSLPSARPSRYMSRFLSFTRVPRISTSTMVWDLSERARASMIFGTALLPAFFSLLTRPRAFADAGSGSAMSRDSTCSERNDARKLIVASLQRRPEPWF